MASPQNEGTSLGALINATVEVHLKDKNQNWMLVSCAGTPTIPASVAGYAVGCLLIDVTNASLYINAGTVASCSFTTKATFS